MPEMRDAMARDSYQLELVEFFKDLKLEPTSVDEGEFGLTVSPV